MLGAMPREMPAEKSSPSSAYIFPERNFLGTGPELAEGVIGRVFVRQHRDFTRLTYQPEVLRETLRRASKLLNDPDRFGGWQPTWWVGVGTALGMVREKNFLPHENDIDVRIGLHYQSNRQACADALKVVRALYRHDFLPVREVYFDGRPMQVAFYDQTNHHALLDIYFFYSGISEGHYVNVNHATLRRKPASFVENRRAMAWPGYQNLKVNVPWPVEDYLAWRFGPEWRTPKRSDELGPVDNACLEPHPRISVLTYGTWDLFHTGHLNLLQRARELGDHLVVGVVSDELCATKGKSPLQNEQQRAEPLRKLPFVSEVFIQRNLDQKEFDIERFGISHLVVGDDWLNHPRFEQVRGYRGVQLHYLPRTPGISSTQLRAAHQASSTR
jgi:glycerol-3-phosphate cytidylyltransferase